MLSAMRRVDQMLSDITVAAAPGPLPAPPSPSPAACFCRERASRKCSTASLIDKEEKLHYCCVIVDLRHIMQVRLIIWELLMSFRRY